MRSPRGGAIARRGRRKCSHDTAARPARPHSFARATCDGVRSLCRGAALAGGTRNGGAGAPQSDCSEDEDERRPGAVAGRPRTRGRRLGVGESPGQMEALQSGRVPASRAGALQEAHQGLPQRRRSQLGQVRILSRPLTPEAASSVQCPWNLARTRGSCFYA